MGAIGFIVLASLITAVVMTLVGWVVNQLPSLKAHVSTKTRVWLAIVSTAVAGLVAAGISVNGSAAGASSADSSRSAITQTSSPTGTAPTAADPSTSSTPDVPADTEAADVPSAGAPKSVTADSGATAITYLYQLPANSAGQPGQQRSPFDVQLAGNQYSRSTSMWTRCAGNAAPQVVFYTGHKYKHLVGTLGVVDSVPSGASVQVQVYADNGIWQQFTVSHGQSLPVDLDISPFSTIGLAANYAEGCPTAGKPLVYIGNGGVL